jgi:hypothetical protein
MATFDIPVKVLVDVSMRKSQRWAHVLRGRAAQGRFSFEEWAYPNKDVRSIRFYWEPEQHVWVRRFLGRFARAWLAYDRQGDDGASA